MPDMTLKAHGAHHIAPDIHGQNFYAVDRQFQDLMSLYMEPGLRAEPSGHLVAVHAGQADVQQHDLRPERPGDFQGGRAVVGGADVVALQGGLVGDGLGYM